MKAVWTRDDIVEIEYDTIEEMLEATYRFSHYHEYPEWREKIFTKVDLDKHYEDTKGDPTWWKTKWGGANLRDLDIQPFLDGKYGELDETEQMIVDLVKDKEGPYGIAMYATKTKYVRDHEVAHSLFYLDSDYRHKCKCLIEFHRPELKNLEEKLSPMYDGENMVDELHAYSGVFYSYWAHPQKLIVPKTMRKELVKLFKKHSKKGLL